MSAPFRGLTVLEYADFIAGPYCAKLLADLGARVVKIEPPETGDSARSHGPFPGNIPDREKSGLFLYLGVNKWSVTLNPMTPVGRELFVNLASTADVLIEDTAPGTMAKMGLDFAILKEINPRIVYVSITPYGQNGPKADWKAHHINSFHASGEGFTLPGGPTHAIFPDRAPVAAGAHLGEYDAGLIAASGTVAALYAREIWGTGQHIDVSKQEATLGMIRMMLTRAQVHGEVIDKSRSYDYGGSFPCKDGYVMIFPREDRQWNALVQIMQRPELADEERFRTRAARIQHADEVNQLISRWAVGLTKEEVYDLLAPSGCPTAQFATSKDIFGSAQLRARQFFYQVDHPKAGKLSYPGRPYKLTAPSLDQTGGQSGDQTGYETRDEMRPAPLLGQHNEEIFCDELGLRRDQLADLQSRGVV